MQRVAAYLRISSDLQEFSSQRHAIEKWLAARPDAKVTWYQDQRSGKRDDRPDFMRMVNAVKAGEHDAVVVFRLDRLSRKALTAASLVFEWLKNGIEFFAVDQPILQLGRENPIRLTVISLFSELAQIEREAIVSRVKAGMAAAKARGAKFGAEFKHPPEIRAEIVRRYRAGEQVDKLATEYGLHRATIFREVKRA